MAQQQSRNRRRRSGGGGGAQAEAAGAVAPGAAVGRPGRRSSSVSDPTAVLRSLGDPPLQGQGAVAEHYMAAVIERAAGLATALAATAGLLATDDDDDADDDDASESDGD